MRLMIIIPVRSLPPCLPQMAQLYTSSACSLALKRLPALSLTLIIELLGGLIISQLHQVIKVYTLIVSFMPAISALSGNLGLQASANTIRGLGTGERSLGNISNCWRTASRSHRLLSVFHQRDEGDEVRRPDSHADGLHHLGHCRGLGLH